MIHARAQRHGGKVEEVALADLAALRAQPDALIWVDVVSPTPDELATLGHEFGIHEVALEDLQVGQRQRPKIELVDTFFPALDAIGEQVVEVEEAVLADVQAEIFTIRVVTMISGIYGMNFEHMPELGWRLGYGWALGLMVVSALGLWVYFKRKGWL
jgi:Mg2+ and Co2+ transporter CorA